MDQAIYKPLPAVEVSSAKLNYQRKLIIERVLFIILLCILAAVLGYVAYELFTEVENELSESQFDALVAHTVSAANYSVSQKAFGVLTLSKLFASGFPNSTQWPLTFMNDFEYITTSLIDTSSSGHLLFAPIVQPGELASFESFAYTKFDEKQFPAGTGESTFGRGVFAVDSTGTRFHDVNGSNDFNSPNEILLPSLQFDEGSHDLLMQNLHYSQAFGEQVDRLIACTQSRANAADPSIIPCRVITDVLANPPTTVVQPPAAMIVEPIYPRNNATHLVGVVSASFDWIDVVADMFPVGETTGVDVVLQTDSTVMTFTVNDGAVSFAGYGDLHSSAYNSYGTSASSVLNSVLFSNGNSPVTAYTVKMYPNGDFFDTYRTSNPMTAAVGAALIVVLVALVCLCFFFWVRMDLMDRFSTTQTKRRFLKYVSHELRTPLNTVCMGLRLLQDDLEEALKAPPEGNEDASTQIGNVRQQANRLPARDGKFGASSPLARHRNNSPPPSTSTASSSAVAAAAAAPMMMGLERGDSASSNNSAQWDADGGGVSPFQQQTKVWMRLAQEVFQNVHNAVDIVNDILQYDEVDSGGLVLELHVVSIWSLIERTAREYQMQATKASIDLVVNLGDAKQLSKRSDTNDSTISTGLPDALIEDAGLATTMFTPASANSLRRTGSTRLVVNKRVDATYREHRVIGDTMRLTQVIRNVISCRLKETPEGGELTITATIQPFPEEQRKSKTFTLYSKENVTYERQGNVLVTIKDNGAGMTAERVQNLFSEGVQFKPLESGGLGLFIAKGVLERHEGSLTVSSEGVDKGTTVTLLIPLYRVPDMELPTSAKIGSERRAPAAHLVLSPREEEGEKQQQQQQHATLGDIRSIEESGVSHPRTAGPRAQQLLRVKRRREIEMPSFRILVVDDVLSNRKMLIRLLTSKKHDCVEAKDGQEAIDKYSASLHSGTPFDTILMDYEMPGTNGPTATRILREMGCDCMIIGVTGNVMQDDVRTFKAHGADHVLSKPMRLPDLERLWVGNTGSFFANPTMTAAAATAVQAVAAAGSSRGSKTRISIDRGRSKTMRVIPHEDLAAIKLPASGQSSSRGEGEETAGTTSAAGGNKDDIGSDGWDLNEMEDDDDGELLGGTGEARMKPV